MTLSVSSSNSFQFSFSSTTGNVCLYERISGYETEYNLVISGLKMVDCVRLLATLQTCVSLLKEYDETAAIRQNEKITEKIKSLESQLELLRAEKLKVEKKDE